ncbi:hypothetical protein HPB52_021068 [Rhipicephalus sanguineus]|uniref:Secreted protein n=1 Tax=Rhipicephalus sanguineus TaxID=34632 RepID=A0A9D4T205_RHISA|nr:hypothetical protein HPB52_021068 [Rhipicephalus sanguineus]
MNRAALCAALLILGMASVNEAIRCRLPQIREGEWVLGADGRQCTSVVKKLCDGHGQPHNGRLAARRARKKRLRRGQKDRKISPLSLHFGRLTTGEELGM